MNYNMTSVGDIVIREFTVADMLALQRIDFDDVIVANIFLKNLIVHKPKKAKIDYEALLVACEKLNPSAFGDPDKTHQVQDEATQKMRRDYAFEQLAKDVIAVSESMNDVLHLPFSVYCLIGEK